MEIGKQPTSLVVKELVVQVVIVPVLAARVIDQAPEEEASQVGETGPVVAELETDLVVAELLTDLVVAELLTVLEAVELETDLVEAELLIALEAVELETALVAVEPERVLVVALELGQGAALAGLDHPRAQPEVLAETKSVTAAPLHDLPLLAAVEDLGMVVAATMHEPAAAEAVAAWVAAE
jgi:hypothetical protein